MSLSTFMLPYPISSYYYIATSYTIGVTSTFSNENVLQVREKNIADIIDDYIQQIEKENNYINVTAKLNESKLEKSVHSFNSTQTTLSITDVFDYYTEYVQLTLNKETFYFKTIEQCNDFINDIKKYKTVSYEIQEKVIKEIGSETKEDVLKEKIKNAEIKYVDRQIAIAASYSIKDTSAIALDSPIVNFASNFIGNPYKYGGTSLTNGADCSGFVQSIYANFGITLPRTASAQANIGKRISFNEIQPGDLIFYSNGGTTISHVAIYAGGSKIIHAGKPSTGINISTVNIMTKICAVRLI